jgi:hypothetical protein
MTAPDSLPPRALAEDSLDAASPDLLRAMVKTFADALMSAEADAFCNAEYGQVSDERVNHRNGYRPREWDTRAGTVELAIPKLRSGSYFPHWLPARHLRLARLLGVDCEHDPPPHHPESGLARHARAGRKTSPSSSPSSRTSTTRPPHRSVNYAPRQST